MREWHSFRKNSSSLIVSMICDIIGIAKNKRTPKQWEFDEEKITVGEFRRWNGIDIFGVFEVLKDLGKIRYINKYQEIVSSSIIMTDKIIK